MKEGETYETRYFGQLLTVTIQGVYTSHIVVKDQFGATWDLNKDCLEKGQMWEQSKL